MPPGHISNCYSVGNFSRKTTSAKRYGGVIVGLWYQNDVVGQTSAYIRQVFGTNATNTYQYFNGNAIQGNKDGLLSSTSELIGMSKSISNHFSEDTTNLNQGLPVLSWEQNYQKIY